MLTYLLVPMAEYDAASSDGSAFPLAERTRWDFVLDVAAFLDGAGEVTVDIQQSPTAGDGTWTSKLAVAINAAGRVTKTTYGGAPDFTFDAFAQYLRVVLSGMTGRPVLRVTGSARFVDASVDQTLFSQPLREWEDGFSRTVEQAENDVLAMLAKRTPVQAFGAIVWPPAELNYRTPAGAEPDQLLGETLADNPVGVVLDAAMDLPGFRDTFRREVTQQAEWLYRRWKLEKKGDPAAEVSLRGMGYRHPDMGKLLRPYRNRSSSVYRGRG